MATLPVASVEDSGAWITRTEDDATHLVVGFSWANNLTRRVSITIETPQNTVTRSLAPGASGSAALPANRQFLWNSDGWGRVSLG